MIPKTLFTCIIILLLAGCGGYGDSHEYRLTARVSDVITCDNETEECQVHVVKGENKKFKEVWTVSGKAEKGDDVYKLCSFKVAPIEGPDDSKSAGLSSRSQVETTLNNTNCTTQAFIL